MTESKQQQLTPPEMFNKLIHSLSIYHLLPTSFFSPPPGHSAITTPHQGSSMPTPLGIRTQRIRQKSYDGNEEDNKITMEKMINPHDWQ